MTEEAQEELRLLVKARRLAKSGAGRRIRESAGLSQLEVATAARLSGAGVLCRWELGQRVPHGGAAVRWAEVLEQLVRAEATS